VAAIAAAIASVQTTIAVPEGLRLDQTLDRLAEQSGIAREEFEAVVADPRGLGLPRYADGSAEGYLFPATYTFDPDVTADYDLRQTAQGSVSVEHAEGKALLKAYGARPAFLQADGATLLNRDVTTTVLGEIARSPKTPSYLRREWLRWAGVRAVLLGQRALADQLAPQVQKVEPELSEAMAAYLAAPEADRARQAVWILLHNPGLRWYISQSLSARTYQPTRSGQQSDWQRGYLRPSTWLSEPRESVARLSCRRRAFDSCTRTTGRHSGLKRLRTTSDSFDASIALQMDLLHELAAL